MTSVLSPFHETFQKWTQENIRGDISDLSSPVGSATARDKGLLFAQSLFLVSSLRTLIDDHWILKNKDKTNQVGFGVVVRDFLKKPEGRLLDFLESSTEELNPGSLQKLSRLFREVATLLLAATKPQSSSYPEFIESCVREISRLCEGEGLVSRTLYRAFDRLDEAFALDYSGDLRMQSDSSNPERLYEGAGEGVQTSYESILTILRQLRLPENAHVMDLGSGFGRVGLTAGLWRQDLRFSGYEYVEHRVAASEAASKNCGLSDRVKFYRQDLSSREFEIPEADVYYMYDPFCRETYRQVLNRLNEVAARRPLTVVTKADAGSWFSHSLNQARWDEPELCDGGTILIFRTKP